MLTRRRFFGLIAGAVAARTLPVVKIHNRHLYGRVTLSGAQIAASRAYPPAFLSAVVLEHQRLYNEFQTRLNQSLVHSLSQGECFEYQWPHQPDILPSPAVGDART